MKSKVLCFHGFLGNPGDFEFLKEEFDVFTLDLSKLVSKTPVAAFLVIEKLLIKEQINFILGYSFGARLALYYKICHGANITVLCLAGHMGIKNKEDIQKRKILENKFIEKIKTLNEEDFISYWNSLDLFEFDGDLQKINYNNAHLYFENYGLSKQPYLVDIKHNVSQIHFLYGELDKKYSIYAKENLKNYDVEYVLGAGHRLTSHKREVINWVKRKTNEC